jgi:hypothetical protein
MADGFEKVSSLDFDYRGSSFLGGGNFSRRAVCSQEKEKTIKKIKQKKWS